MSYLCADRNTCAVFPESCNTRQLASLPAANGKRKLCACSANATHSCVARQASSASPSLLASGAPLTSFYFYIYFRLRYNHFLISVVLRARISRKARMTQHAHKVRRFRLSGEQRRARGKSLGENATFFLSESLRATRQSLAGARVQACPLMRCCVGGCNFGCNSKCAREPRAPTLSTDAQRCNQKLARQACFESIQLASLGFAIHGFSVHLLRNRALCRSVLRASERTRRLHFRASESRSPLKVE